ncbi:alpha-ketoglutarate-dependent dioxygenase alkB homolog 7, mitochondrial-like [Dysidea avara]|uniref:alpha-ketoglutarate-dependent dioxygenase alkB homolog 7, mitochondrial-like n=1 Tax=Dysidea avara TaxID=196820 RepID=UPI00332903FF
MCAKRLALALVTRVARRRYNSTSSLINVSPAAVEDAASLTITESFISNSEQQQLMKEVELSMGRKKYNFDHWDDAIHGYKETEKTEWSRDNQPVITRLQSAVGSRDLLLPHIHVLDLSNDGYIKPHVDSVKFCGRIIAGVSLLSSCVMRLQHEQDKHKWIVMLLPPLSVYIIRDVTRYQYTHEILADDVSYHRGQKIDRERRVSLICRTKPQSSLL